MNIDRLGADLGCGFEKELALGNYCSPAIKLARRYVTMSTARTEDSAADANCRR